MFFHQRQTDLADVVQFLAELLGGAPQHVVHERDEDVRGPWPGRVLAAERAEGEDPVEPPLDEALGCLRCVLRRGMADGDLTVGAQPGEGRRPGRDRS